MKKGLIAILVLFSVILPGASVPGEQRPAYIEMEVKGIGMDPSGQSPIVILADKGGKKAFPIWIGFLEASAIERELNKTTPARPMTHDLFHSVLGHMQAKVKEVKIVELKNQTYYATLFLTHNKKSIEVDARPSDAIIMALKSKAPILLSAKIFDEQAVSITKTDSGSERHGIRVQELTPTLASHFNFKGRKGVLVAEVVPGSSSESSGIRPGDIITRIHQKEVGSTQEFEEAFDAAREARSIRISIFRDQKIQEITLTPKP